MLIQLSPWFFSRWLKERKLALSHSLFLLLPPSLLPPLTHSFSGWRKVLVVLG